MPFPTFKLPTWNIKIDLYKWDAATAKYVLHVGQVDAQHYFGSKDNEQVWLEHYAADFELDEYQAGPIYVLFLAPKGTAARDWRKHSLSRPDLVKFIHPDLGTMWYTIHQVEPRWCGFANEHVAMACASIRTSVVVL